MRGRPATARGGGGTLKQRMQPSCAHTQPGTPTEQTHPPRDAELVERLDEPRKVAALGALHLGQLDAVQQLGPVCVCVLRVHVCAW
jgi:hypothetical protein